MSQDTAPRDLSRRGPLFMTAGLMLVLILLAGLTLSQVVVIYRTHLSEQLKNLSTPEASGRTHAVLVRFQTAVERSMSQQETSDQYLKELNASLNDTISADVEKQDTQALTHVALAIVNGSRAMADLEPISLERSTLSETVARAYRLDRQNRCDQAIPLYESVMQNQEAAEVLLARLRLHMAVCHFRLEQSDKALAALAQVPRDRAHISQEWRGLARTAQSLTIMIEQLAERSEILQEIADPFRRGKFAYEQLKYPTAEKILADVSSKSRHYAWAQFYLARSREELGRQDQAIEIYETLLSQAIPAGLKDLILKRTVLISEIIVADPEVQARARRVWEPEADSVADFVDRVSVAKNLREASADAAALESQFLQLGPQLYASSKPVSEMLAETPRPTANDIQSSSSVSGVSSSETAVSITDVSPAIESAVTVVADIGPAVSADAPGSFLDRPDMSITETVAESFAPPPEDFGVPDSGLGSNQPELQAIDTLRDLGHHINEADRIDPTDYGRPFGETAEGAVVMPDAPTISGQPITIALGTENCTLQSGTVERFDEGLAVVINKPSGEEQAYLYSTIRDANPRPPGFVPQVNALEACGFTEVPTPVLPSSP